MKVLKYFSFFIILTSVIYACGTSSLKNNLKTTEEPVVIKNDSLEYEIIIFDIGFTNYLNTIAKPVGYHSQFYLENKNRQYVPVWNSRVNNAAYYNSNIYENNINYDPHTNYGYDVNYKLFNYFEFAQRKYKMVLR
ncbi:DUF6146 family protein [Tenacibaculum insulae]|uniref:DUF6146 family protein n=1 Tax=Tenacibaculum insulae TaxID=2029677 RepID=UPI003AB550D8